MSAHNYRIGSATLTAAIAAAIAILAGCSSPGGHRAEDHLPRFAPGARRAVSGPVGPTLRLDYGRGEAQGNPIGGFMYFVPLVSPELVSITETPGNAQRVRVLSATRQFAPGVFSVACEFGISGTGSHRTQFDHAKNLLRNEQKLAEGGVVERVLDSISIEGPASGVIEIEGVVTNRVPTVTEVRLRFNAHGQSSPVAIGLIDFRRRAGTTKGENEMIARVNTIAFQRTEGRPRMAVTVSTVKRKDAGDSVWQKLKGGVTGVVANMLLKPITVERAGNDAMLDFGYALAAGDAAFTFPEARSLKPATAR